MKLLSMFLFFSVLFRNLRITKKAQKQFDAKSSITHIQFQISLCLNMKKISVFTNLVKFFTFLLKTGNMVPWENLEFLGEFYFVFKNEGVGEYHWLFSQKFENSKT